MTNGIVEKKYAFVFCGGGGKGAFQIGSLLALQKAGYLNNIGAIAGTSVGALNATLLALGDLQESCRIWRSISPEILLSMAGDDESGICSRQGLTDLIDSLDLDRVSKLDIPFYVGTTDENWQTFYKKLNSCPTEEIREYLLASSAIPGVYGERNVSGKRLMDGGLSGMGNTPVRPLYDEGFRDFIVIALDSDFSIHDLRSFIFKDYAIDEMSDANFFVIQPLDHIGGFFDGMLNFTPEKINRLIEQGEKDTKKILENDYSYIFQKNPGKAFQMIFRNYFFSRKDFEGFVGYVNSRDNLKEKSLPLREREKGGVLERLLKATAIVLGEEIGASTRKDLFKICGWRLQTPVLNSFGDSDYRLLDPDSATRLVFSANELLYALHGFCGLKTS